MNIREELILRAFEIARKDGNEITEENAEAYFMAAVAEESKLLEDFINSSKGTSVIKKISGNMSTRMYSKLNK